MTNEIKLVSPGLMHIWYQTINVFFCCHARVSVACATHLQHTLFTCRNANSRQKLQEEKNVLRVFTFSFCSDLNSISFPWSLFSLASSSSRCLAAIIPSSLATSSCWARHCCSYNTHTCKYVTETNKKQVIGHHQLSEKNPSQD